MQAEREAGRVYVLLAGATSRDKPHDESELVAVLREQLAAERQAHAEARRIIAGLVERIPAIAAPAETPEASERGEEQQGRGEPRPATGGAQETSESLGGQGSGTARGSWWRRMFGG